MEVDYPPPQICMDQSSKGNGKSTPDTDHSYSSVLVDDSHVDESYNDYSIKPNSQNNVHLQGKLEMDAGDNLCQGNIDSETGLYTEATIVIRKPTEDGRIKTQEERLGTTEKCAAKGNALSQNWGQIHIVKENDEHSTPQNLRDPHPHSVDHMDTSDNLIKVENLSNSAIGVPTVPQLESEHCYGKNSRDYNQEIKTNQNVEGSDDTDMEIDVEIGVEEVEVNTLENVDEGSGMEVEEENQVLIEPEEVEVSTKAEGGKSNTPESTLQTLKALATPFQHSETKSSDVDSRILALVIHSLENESLADHFLYSFMTVRVHLVNGITGKPMQCQNGEMVLPRMTKPWDFKVNRTKTAVWEELCLFKESYSYVMEEKHQAVFLFEVMDASSLNTANLKNRLAVAGEGRVIAWGFLPVTNSKGKGRKWLQLYWPQKKTLTKQGEIEVKHCFINFHNGP
ncbi:uncharacterized protein LOC106167565 isoform X1 [Lingula anatina]|uniref:Uncharacterized protein LOC106167565 isoform X1 n=1 Tax=Lingula anatina TaxID=7574 RepID=A0A1S3IUD3_LINAN|nr:uncharacterized protein LOC106167565 isoform X1 [Lingula anatina]XP_013401818.1 uncharacterized protein LOC106167565 isoform X1 [Lingula anatina]|eukprot:XP_013401817.1 uncharacterized protein LOC106167565 isoform X1 [Lingula anatina]